MKKITIGALSILIILILIGGIYIYNNKFSIKKDFICYQDSDCIIKENGVNCPIASHKDDTSLYGVRIPPSETECPKANETIGFCLEGKCSIKYDCSKCAILKSELDDFCLTHMEGTSSWICKMYTECIC